VYWCVGLRPTAGHFFLFLFLFISEIMAAQSLGMLISAAIKDFAAAQSFSFVLVRNIATAYRNATIAERSFVCAVQMQIQSGLP
jgi:ABC-2 type transporter